MGTGFINAWNELPKWPPRRRRSLLDSRRLSIFAAGGIVVFIILSPIYQASRWDLAAKYSPTAFSASHQRSIGQWPWQAASKGHDERRDILAHRREWKKIGGGCEGEVSIYEGTAIKTFFASNSPLRNCLRSPEASVRIPAEIPASVLLGGLGGEFNERTDFMPVKDFFLVHSPENGNVANWHFLTPYLPAGSLTQLAKRLRTRQLSHQELDAVYRPSFNRMLSALEKMHNEFLLCHDDVKPSNLFIANSTSDEDMGTHWILSDFGNVREIDHPYHSSRIWTVDGEQNKDCRINDVLRLVKTYAMFLRSSLTDAQSFDSALLLGVEPWSELYWSATRGSLNGSMAANKLLEVSLFHSPRNASAMPARNVQARRSLSNAMRFSSLEEDTSLELERGMHNPESKARWFGAAAVLGIPLSACQSGVEGVGAAEQYDTPEAIL
ncbi:hypothetical protein F5Y15DRAFT_417286 [Xylariaceae sp. FL0016]|nr:hypothetical protein F5Y15DRAFT_417286 [Xylariaceae sp. FL0016]